jgi:hypothetical protein
MSKMNVFAVAKSLLTVTAVLSMTACAIAPASSGASESRRSTEALTITTCLQDQLTVVSATASSVEGSHWAASNAIDGDYTSRWSSAKGNPQWLKLDLGQRSFISSVSIDWQTAYSTNYDIQLSDNGSSWAPVNMQPNATGGSAWIWNLNASARYVRIYSRAATNYGNVSISTVGVFGDANPSCDTSTQQCGGLVRLNATAATASSIEGSAFPASNAIDASYNTRWSSKASDNQWLAIDLGASAKVDSVRLTWDSSYAKEYQLQAGTSMTGPWTTVYANTAGTGGVETIPALAATTRYLRVLGVKRATSYGFSLYNVDVYGTRDLVCQNMLTGPWAFKEADFTPSNVYAITGNSIYLNYDGDYYWTTDGFNGVTFEQSAAGIKQGSKYRLVLDIVNNGYVPVILAATLSGAGAAQSVEFDGNGQATIDFDVTAAPGAAPVIDLTSHPILAIPGPYVTGVGIGLGSYTVSTTLKQL